MKNTIQTALQHVSIRSYKPDPIPENLLTEILNCGLRSSSSGNMQSWSVIVSTEHSQRERLYRYHLEQEMILEAPLVLTFCADFYRMRKWLNVRNAKDGFDDLSGFMVAAGDAFIAAQSISLAAEANGLGICYMGTTLWCAPELVKEFDLPKGVMPITSLVMGYPKENPPLRDRLPLSAVVHRSTYKHFNERDILEVYAEREIRGWKRYQDHGGEEFQKKSAAAGITNLAQYYTSDLKYSKDAFATYARSYLDAMKAQDFWNF